MKKRNKYAVDLFSPKYRKRVIKPKKGKGSFKRKKKNNLAYSCTYNLYYL